MTIFLIIAAILIPLVGAWRTKKAGRVFLIGILAFETVICAAIALMPSGEGAVRLWKFTEGMELMLGNDAISKIFAVVISAVWTLACAHAFDYLANDENRSGFYRFYMLTLSALMVIVFSGNFVTFFIGFEAMTLLSMPMVIHERTPEARGAAMKYLGFSIFGASAALAGLFVLNHYGVSTVFTPGGVIDPERTAGCRDGLLAVWLIMIVGFGAKAGMFPLHSWLPTAHPVAPSPASAVLSGIITKCGVLAVIRVTFYLFGADFIRGTWAQYAAIIISLITVFMGSMMALGQKLIKKRLAYSTVSQVSYVLFGLFLMTEAGFKGAVTQAVFHMVAKNALFLWAGAVIHETGLTGVDQLKGMGRRMPAAMWGFTLASLSLIGIPPTGGFVSKWYLAAGALSFDSYALGVCGVCVLIISAILTAAYLLPVVASAFFPGSGEYATPVERHEPAIGMLIPILALAIATVVFGLFPGIITEAIAPVISALFG